MPNWTFNSMVITGERERLELIDSIINGDYSKTPAFKTSGVISLQALAAIEYSMFLYKLEGVPELVSGYFIGEEINVYDIFKSLLEDKDLLNEYMYKSRFSLIDVRFKIDENGLLPRIAKFIVEVYNNLYCKAKDNPLKLLYHQSFENIFSYNEFISYREAVWAINEIIFKSELPTANRNSFDHIMKQEKENVLDTLWWYNHNNKAYGTKWIPDIDSYEFDTDSIIMSFSSAWNVPYSMIKSLSVMFDVQIDNEYECEGEIGQGSVTFIPDGTDEESFVEYGSEFERSYKNGYYERESVSMIADDLFEFSLNGCDCYDEYVSLDKKSTNFENDVRKILKNHLDEIIYEICDDDFSGKDIIKAFKHLNLLPKPKIRFKKR